MNFLIGLLAGLFGGLVGVGGGVIMIPLMVRFAKLSQHRAHGTSLIALVFTGLAGAATYAAGGSLDLFAAALLAVTAIPFARAGALFAHSLPEWKLRRFFGVFLIFVSVLLLLKPYLSNYAGAVEGLARAFVLLAGGICTGFLSGMMGVGGGSIMVPLLVLLIGFDQHTAQGTSLLVMVPAGAAGAWAHWRLGNAEKKILPRLIPGILAGTAAGGLLAHYSSDAALRAVFAAVLIWTGTRYLWSRRG